MPAALIALLKVLDGRPQLLLESVQPSCGSRLTACVLDLLVDGLGCLVITQQVGGQGKGQTGRARRPRNPS